MNCIYLWGTLLYLYSVSWSGQNNLDTFHSNILQFFLVGNIKNLLLQLFEMYNSTLLVRVTLMCFGISEIIPI